MGTGFMRVTGSINQKQHLPAESRVRAALHALAPGLAAKRRGTSAARATTRATGTAHTGMSAMTIARATRTHASWCCRAGPFNGSIEINADAVARLARILVCQCEHKGCHVSDG